MSARNRTLRTVIAALVALPVLSGCATRVRSDFDRDAVFSQYDSFDWLAPPVRASEEELRADPEGPFARNSLLDKRIRAAVTSNLRARGFQYAEDGSSDIRLNYHVTFSDKLVGSGSDFGYSSYYRRGSFSSGFNWSVRQYKEGTIIIDVVDRAKDQLVWRGWMVSRNRDGNYDEAEINRAVNQILAKFPPGR
ncbi:MAG: DUF4136 domain-containing protein [Deltaproteobacteria bacterium]|nr:DUF4136 domain-containing protein [Deltaproteobacteria bacterium]MBW2543634.1 DUF4136 domain-containing protein [Deltaproteobacteria bacterium]